MSVRHGRRISYPVADGVVDEHELVERDGAAMMTSLHRPTGPVTHRVLFCSPIGVPFDHNVRSEVLLARRLAGDGAACRRFHYRGTGESDGDPREVDQESLLRDARWALDLPDDRSLPLTLIGTRWGATVALALCRDEPAARLVLVDPVVSPRRLTREIAFARKASDLDDTERSLEEQIATEGGANVGGLHLPGRLLGSITGVDAGELTAIGRRQVLILGRLARGRLASWHRQLVEQLTAGGAVVEEHAVDDDLQAWINDLPESPEEAKPMLRAALELVPGWLSGTAEAR